MRGLWHGILAVICGSVVIVLVAGPTNPSRTYYPEMIFGLCVFLGPIGMLVTMLVYGGLHVLLSGLTKRRAPGLLGWLWRPLAGLVSGSIVLVPSCVCWCSGLGYSMFPRSVGLFVLSICLPGLICSVTVLGLLINQRQVPEHETRCRACEYDLTGNVSGICPECGDRVLSLGPDKDG